MTPKEKAKELYSKYEFVYIQNYTSSHEVKECALIAVDEIINNLKDDDFYIEGETNINEIIDYWEKVKQEIENL